MDAYQAAEPTHGGRGMPRGAIPTPPSQVVTPAIGFCPMCGVNARQTCSIRGMFDCPNCTFWWYDSRVGEQPRDRSFDDWFSPEAAP